MLLSMLGILLTGCDYCYFVVYESKSLDYPGAYLYDRLMEIVKGL